MFSLFLSHMTGVQRKVEHIFFVKTDPIDFNWFFKNTVSDIVKVGLVLENGLKERDKIL